MTRKGAEDHMAHFHIVHVVSERMPGLQAYQEVIDCVRWGFEQLGHEATYGINQISDKATNIIFGGHVAPELVLSAPEGTIYYNLEQIRGHPEYNHETPAELLRYIVDRCHIWDYSGANIDTWNDLRPRYPVKCIPVCYAPVLRRIKSAEKQDIDVLIYGSVGERRLSVFSSLRDLGITTVFASGLYGAGRDNLISRSKIVLNVSFYQHAKIFEIVRVSYLPANSKAVIADVSPETYVEGDISQGIKFSLLDGLARTCRHLLTNEDHRIRLERQGFECISRRDIRTFLSAAMA